MDHFLLGVNKLSNSCYSTGCGKESKKIMEDTEKNMMKESLITRIIEEEEREDSVTTWDVFTQEVKRQIYIAGPMMIVMISLYLFQIVAMMMVGHLGQLALSSTALASSLCAVTGTSFLTGLAGALETLCGQAYGAKQCQKMGNQTYSAIISLFCVAVVLSLTWFNMEKLLTLLGQDPLIAYEAGRFTRWLIPTLFANAIFQPLIRYFQTQSLIFPMLLSTVITLSVHIPLCWVLVFKSGLKNVGGALAISISNWLNVIFLVLYMRYSSACEKSRAPIPREIFHGIGEFFRFAIPSAIMICLQWWSYEFIILLSGLLPNPQLETSVLSVCLTTISTLYAIPYALSLAVRTRVSNELGAGKPQAARMAVYVALFLAVIEFIVVGGTLYCTRNIFGYVFSNDIEVVKYVSVIAPLVCLSAIVDDLQEVLSGVARGCGWQDIGAYINLSSLYLCGIPVAGILGFWLKLKGKGLWIGILIGATVQTVMLSVVTARINWEKQANKVRERMLQGRSGVTTLN